MHMMHMRAKHTLFRRGGIYYSKDTATGQQKSLRTRDEAEALQLINARNEACRQPVLNLQLARAYLTASDPAFVARTWQIVMAQLQCRGRRATVAGHQGQGRVPLFQGYRQTPRPVGPLVSISGRRHKGIHHRLGRGQQRSLCGRSQRSKT